MEPPPLPQLSEHNCADLKEKGWTVVDSFFDEAFAYALRDEMVMLAASGAMQPNRTYFANPAGGRYLFSKPHIYEVDCHQEEIQTRIAAGSVPQLASWFQRSADAWLPLLQQALPSMELLTGDTARTVKLQWNRGGGAFPLHYDNPAPPSKRALTCVLYLNPEWTPSDRGEIVLVPFLHPPVRVPPVMNRAVLFLSDRVLHRVLPSATERYCVTTWVDGEGTNLPEDTQLRLPPSAMQDIHGTAASLRAAACQRSLSRAVYKEEYEESLRECMAGAPGLEEMLDAHTLHVEGVARNAPLQRLVDALRALKPPPGAEVTVA